MLSGTKLAGIAITGVGVAGGIGTGIYFSQQDNTIRGKLISEKVTLISSTEEYWAGFNEAKQEAGFIDLINAGNEKTSAWGMREGGNALKNWCNKSLNKKYSEELFEKVKKYCSKPILTIEEKINKLGNKWVTKWEQKLGELKRTSNAGLVEDLRKINGKVTSLDINEQKIVAEALEKWCEGNKQVKLFNSKIDEIWGKLEKRCFEQENDS